MRKQDVAKPKVRSYLEKEQKCVEATERGEDAKAKGRSFQFRRRLFSSLSVGHFAYNLIRVLLSPEVCRMLSKVISTHALYKVTALSRMRTNSSLISY